MTGIAIESATEHVEVRVEDDAGEVLAERAEDVGHGHTRRLAPLVGEALAAAGVAPRELRWVAADLGPGSFTGVRVGLATAQAIAMAAGAPLIGASSLAALAHAAGFPRAILVPVVPAGRRDVYAAVFRGDAHGDVHAFTAPFVGTPARVLERVAEAAEVLVGSPVRFVGPGAARERAAFETAWPGAIEPLFRAAGLSAADLAHASRARGGRARGLPAPDQPLRAVYVRPAQAEGGVRRRALAGIPVLLRDMTRVDVPAVVAIERRVFPDPWPEESFTSELRQRGMFARIAEREGRLAGYALTWFGSGIGHLGNLAVTPEQRRRGVAAALLDDLLVRAHAMSVKSVTLEVRVGNAEAQELYRSRGFRVAGLRRRYYRDGGEDALVMEWQPRRAAHETTAPHPEALS